MGEAIRGAPRRVGRSRGAHWKRALWSTIAMVGLLLTAGVAYLGWSSGGSEVATEGAPAPPFILPDQQGRPVDLAQYLGRKPVVLVFYMTYG